MAIDTDTSSIGKVLVVVGLVLMSAGLAAAAPTIDTSGSDATSTTSDTLDNDEITDFNASQNTTIQYEFIGENSTSPVVTVRDPDTDAVYYENSSLENVSVGSEGTHWNVSFTADELADVPMEINENKSVIVRVANGSNTSDYNEYTLYLNNTDERSVFYVGDDEADDSDDVTVSDDEGREVFGMTIPFTADDKTTVDTTRKVAGDNTTVYVVFANDTAATDYSDAYDGLDAGISRLSSYTAIDGEGLKPYNSELPDDLDTDDTTATYVSDVGGESAMKIELGEDKEDADEVDVETHSDRSILFNLNTYRQAYGIQTTLAGALGIGGGGLLVITGVLFVFGRPENPFNEGE
jgi:hypothetical protein